MPTPLTFSYLRKRRTRNRAATVRERFVQTDRLGADLPQTIVSMITSNMHRAGHPSRVTVMVGSETAKGSGLLMDSVIMTDNLATIHYSEIVRAIGTFTGLKEIDAALRKALAL